MRTIRTKVYLFNELNDKAKENAINWYRNADRLDYSHIWEDIKYDAKEIGLNISELSDHRPNKGNFITSAYDVSCKIVQEHGENCQTHKTAVNFGENWSELVTKYSDGINTDKVTEENEYDFDKEADELEEEFLHSILEDYRIMYNNNCEYTESDEYIINMLTANEYEFKADGTIF